MSSSRDKEIIELWLAKQSSPHTRSCYRRDVERILSYSIKSLKDITLAALQRFAQSLVDAGLERRPRSRAVPRDFVALLKRPQAQRHRNQRASFQLWLRQYLSPAERDHLQRSHGH